MAFVTIPRGALNSTLIEVWGGRFFLAYNGRLLYFGLDIFQDLVKLDEYLMALNKV